jgi:hypothetical protein
VLKVAYPAKQVDLVALSSSSIILWTVLPDGGGVEPVFQREGQRHSDFGAFSLYSVHLFCVLCFNLFFCDVGTYFMEEILICNVTYLCFT